MWQWSVLGSHGPSFVGPWKGPVVVFSCWAVELLGCLLGSETFWWEQLYAGGCHSCQDSSAVLER